MHLFFLLGLVLYSRAESELSTEANAATGPITPTNLMVTMTRQFATLTWHLSDDPKDSVDGYLLRVGLNISSLTRLTISGGQTTYKVSYLKPNTVYYFILQSFIYVNNEPVFSKAVTASDTTPPPDLGPPTDLIVDHIFSAPEVDLNWNKAKYPAKIDGYLIEWCSEGICNKTTCSNTSSSRVEYRLTGLSVPEIYDVKVFSYVIYKNEKILSKPASVRFQVRSYPPDVMATALAPTAALISWTLRTSGRNLRARIICAGRTYLENATVGSFACNGFKPWSLQSAEVDLCPVTNGFCSSSKSATFFTPPEVFPPPIISSIEADFYSVIVLRLEEPKNYGKYNGFQIEYCSSSQSCNIIYIQSGSQSVKLRNLLLDTSYDLTVRAFIGTKLRRHFSKPANATVRTFKSAHDLWKRFVEVWDGRPVIVRQSRICSSGNVALKQFSFTRMCNSSCQRCFYDASLNYFAVSGCIMQHGICSADTCPVKTIFDVKMPEAPVDLNANALSDQAVYLSWKIYNSIVINSEISYDGGQKIKTYGNDEDAVIRGLEPRKAYVFRVRCCGYNGCGQETSVVVVTKTGVPDVPRHLKAERKTPGQITTSWEAPLNWNAVDTGYLLQWKCDTDSNAVRLEYTVNSYAIFTDDKDCKVSLAAFSVDDDMLRSGDPVYSKIV